MEQLFNKIFAGDNVNPPENVKQAIYYAFKNPVNIDWYVRNEIYEAIFYDNSREHIARINARGKLLDYKINLELDALPERIKKTVESKGEIMNVVSIHNKKNISYEVIIRDAELKRYIIKINNDGNITEEKLL
jgi:hypothetical protein